MTEFTPEWIASQRKLMVALPKHLSVGDVQKNHVNINQNFHTEPLPTKLNIMDVNIFSTMSETCLIAQSVCDACNHYPKALDHIERLQKRVEELEIYENKNQSAKEVGIYWVQKLREEEARADLHANLNRKIANALGKKINENWSDIPEIVVQLKQRIAELEEALAKIANYESMRFRLSPYEYGVLEQIVGIAEHALKGDK